MAKFISPKGSNIKFAYAKVFEAESFQGGDAKYSICAIISKDDKPALAAFRKAYDAAVEEGKASKWGGKLPKFKNETLRDGDEERDEDPNFANSYFFNASSKLKPAVVNGQGAPIFSAEGFYSGCEGRISVNLYPYAASGNKGIGAGLNNLQCLIQGERMGGGASAKADFEIEDEDEF